MVRDDEEAWHAAVHGVAKSQALLSDWITIVSIVSAANDFLSFLSSRFPFFCLTLSLLLSFGPVWESNKDLKHSFHGEEGFLTFILTENSNNRLWVVVPSLLISRTFWHSWKIAHLLKAFRMRKIITDKDDATVYRILYAVFQVFLKCHSCLEETPQSILPTLLLIF